MKDYIEKAYKVSAIAMVVFLVLGAVFKARTFIAGFELAASIFVLLFGLITVYELYNWYKKETSKPVVTPTPAPTPTPVSTESTNSTQN